MIMTSYYILSYYVIWHHSIDLVAKTLAASFHQWLFVSLMISLSIHVCCVITCWLIGSFSNLVLIKLCDSFWMFEPYFEFLVFKAQAYKWDWCKNSTCNRANLGKPHLTPKMTDLLQQPKCCYLTSNRKFSPVVGTFPMFFFGGGLGKLAMFSTTGKNEHPNSLFFEYRSNPDRSLEKVISLIFGSKKQSEFGHY